jgi:hypothetical protein
LAPGRYVRQTQVSGPTDMGDDRLPAGASSRIARAQKHNARRRRHNARAAHHNERARRALHERKNTMPEPADPMRERLITMREPVAHCASGTTQCARASSHCVSGTLCSAKPSKTRSTGSRDRSSLSPNARAGRSWPRAHRVQIYRTVFRCAWISGSTSSATAAASCS